MILPNQPINTVNKIITVQGKVFYNDRRRRIDLKRPIRDLIENEEALDIYYTMEMCLSKSKIVERVKRLSDEDVMPVLMYFTVRK